LLDQIRAEAADAVIYADAAGLIAFWNNGAERIFGFSKKITPSTNKQLGGKVLTYT